MKVATIQAGQPAKLVAIDAFHCRPRAVTSLGDDDHSYPGRGQSHRQALSRLLIAADEGTKLRADHQYSHEVIFCGRVAPACLVFLEL